MILSRRKVHFYASLTLACVLPLIFLAGLIFRPKVPTVGEAADELFAIADFSTDTPDSPLPERAEVLSEDGVQLLTAVTTVGSSTVLEVQPTEVIQLADVLVYWQAGERSPDADVPVPEDAVLLGYLSGTRQRQFPVPVELQEQQGHLLLYSHGTDTLVAAFPLTLSPN